MATVTHRLKTHPIAFDAVRDGSKTFEVRKNDRLFQTGDLVELIRFDGEDEVGGYMSSLTPRGEGSARLTKRIGWILGGGQYGIEANHVVFALEEAHQGPNRLAVVTDMLERLRAFASVVCKDITPGNTNLTENQELALRILGHAIENAAKVLFVNEEGL